MLIVAPCSLLAFPFLLVSFLYTATIANTTNTTLTATFAITTNVLAATVDGDLIMVVSIAAVVGKVEVVLVTGVSIEVLGGVSF